MQSPTPRLTIQTASLYASGDASTFTGSGGPWGFSPYTSQFGGIINSAGLATDPFSDTVFDVAATDELTFVIALQNLAPSAPAYAVRLHDIMPAGFTIPSDGINLSVTDGAGTPLASTGNPFAAGGLTLADPLAGYDASSGLNVALVTFTLAAGASLPGPYATLQSTATIDAYAATPAGPNLAAADPAAATAATATIVTAAPVPTVTPATNPAALARGQTIAFDISLSIPAGTLQDFTISPLTAQGPAQGPATLAIVSTSLVSLGAGLHTGTPTVSADGTLHLGTVTYAGGSTGSNALTARVIVRADGTASGNATLHTIIGAADPTSLTGRWTADVASNVGVVVPNTPPTLSGISAILGAPGTPTHPYGGLTIGSPIPTQSGTLAITLQDPASGRLGNAITGTINPAGTTFYATGTLAALQDAARQITFTPAAAGTAHFAITLVDAAGGTAQDASQTITAPVPLPTPTPPTPPGPLFDAAFYLAQNPDVAAAGVDPYQHYLVNGWREGRDPSALFSTNFYLTHNPDVARAGLNPLVHFETYGWNEGRAPDADFDPRYYLHQNPDVAAAGMNPLLHFQQNGWHEGRDPSLLFSTTAYAAANPDVAAAGINPLAHYLANGRLEGRAAPLPGATLRPGGPAAADPLIDAAFYDRQRGATLLPTGPAAAQQAAASYHATGWQQGLNPDAVFDTTYYLTRNPDVAAAHIDPLLHYETNGWHEGRDPSAAFSTAKYLAAYSDVANAQMNPLLHYVVYGQAEGRAAFAS